MAKQETTRNRKIGFTIILAIIGIMLIALLSGGIELGNFKFPSIGKKIIVNVDVERTLFDVRIAKTTIDIHQGTFSIGKPLGIVSGIILGEKKLILKMYVRGELCDTQEFEIRGTGVASKRLSCPSEVGANHVRIDLFDTAGKEDSYETNFEVK